MEGDVDTVVRRRPGRPPKPVDPTLGPSHRLGAWLRRLRESSGLTQDAVAKRIKRFSRGTIQRLEAGEINPVSKQHFAAHVLGCGADLSACLQVYRHYQQDIRRSDGRRVTTVMINEIWLPVELPPRGLSVSRRVLDGCNDDSA
jgi:transcriptional regulator with XRE-family HTH domain